MCHIVAIDQSAAAWLGAIGANNGFQGGDENGGRHQVVSAALTRQAHHAVAVGYVRIIGEHTHRLVDYAGPIDDAVGVDVNPEVLQPVSHALASQHDQRDHSADHGVH